MSALLDWIAGRAALPLALAAALLLGGGLAWQSVRIDGLPLLGGGLKAQIASLQAAVAARDLTAARAQAAMLAAAQARAAAGQTQAMLAAREAQVIQTQTETLIRKVPVHVPVQSDRGCIVPWGAVRLLDAAASGASLDDAAARIAPGQPDDAASDVALSEAVALLAQDFGIARANGG